MWPCQFDYDLNSVLPFAQRLIPGLARTDGMTAIGLRKEGLLAIGEALAKATAGRAVSKMARDEGVQLKSTAANWDANFAYFCTAPNTWRRVALAGGDVDSEHSCDTVTRRPSRATSRVTVLASPLRQALGAHLGQVLTPEIAVAIELAVGAPLDQSYAPEQFGSAISGDYSIQVERFSSVLDELHALHVAHWQETEKHRMGLPMRPDYVAAMAQEQAGRMVQFTVRHAPTGELVGNLRMYLAQSTHTQTPYAQEDTLYLKPEHRGGFTVMALLRFAEAALQSIGVQEIRIHSKLVNNADVLMRRMKYQPVALEFVKFLRG